MRLSPHTPKHRSTLQLPVAGAMRPADGKRGAVVFDFCDWDCPVLAAQARARYWTVYRPLGARVVRQAMPA